MFYFIYCAESRRYSSIMSSFCSRVRCLILYSSLNAALMPEACFHHTSSTGLLDLVYLAPLPLLCVKTRLFTSFVLPQYIVPSEHIRRYVPQCFTLFKTCRIQYCATAVADSIAFFNSVPYVFRYGYCYHCVVIVSLHDKRSIF